MASDLTPWDLAMQAIEDYGCDCAEPVPLGEHQCLAGICEHALVTLAAERDKAIAAINSEHERTLHQVDAAIRDAEAQHAASVLRWMVEEQGLRVEIRRLRTAVSNLERWYAAFGAPPYAEVALRLSRILQPEHDRVLGESDPEVPHG